MQKWSLVVVPLILVAAIVTARRDGRRPAELPTETPGTSSDAAAFAPQAAQGSDSWAANLLLGAYGHDFGKVASGSALKHRFPIKNIYAVPLQITSIRHACGCVTFRTSHENQRPLLPGDEGWIDIEMDSRKFIGVKKILVHVAFGPEFASTVSLEISAHVLAEETAPSNESSPTSGSSTR